MSSFDSLQLLKIRLVVVSRSGRDECVQNDAAVSVDTVVHFVLEPPRSPSLLSQCCIGIGTATVRLIGDRACDRRLDGHGSPLQRFGFLLRLFRIVVHKGVECGIGRNQGCVRDHAASVSNQTVLPAELYDLVEDLLVNPFAVPVPCSTERRMIRYVVFQRKSAEPSISEIEMDLLTEASFGVDAVEVRHQLHSEVDDWVDRWAASSGRITASGELPNHSSVHNTVYLPEEVVVREK